MPTILRTDADRDYPEGWLHNEEPYDPWADDDYGPLSPPADDSPELASVLGEILHELRRETADRFEAILSGVQD